MLATHGAVIGVCEGEVKVRERGGKLMLGTYRLEPELLRGVAVKDEAGARVREGEE